MSTDLLEYLAEYCAGGGHGSIRYIEKVALNWYQMGIKTREEARFPIGGRHVIVNKFV